MANNRLWLVSDRNRVCTLLAKWSAGIGWCSMGNDLDKFFDRSDDLTSDMCGGKDTDIRVVPETSDDIVGYGKETVSIKRADGTIAEYSIVH